MNIEFEWIGSTDPEKKDGSAIYTTRHNKIELWLPSFAVASKLYDVLNNVFLDGRQTGHREMSQGIIRTINQVTNKVHEI